MKRIYFTWIVLVLLAVPFACHGQADSSNIVIGTKEHIHSDILQEGRAYWVSLPDSYSEPKYSTQTYPVVYLLDGDTNFHSYTGLQKKLSQGPYASIPEMIVVAIPNIKRTRDLTPTKISGISHRFDSTKTKFANSGGNEQFIAFIENELMPTIGNKYRTNGYKILIGHSFGGLAVINTLMNYTELFNAYIAIDPSLWWDNRIMLQQADHIFQEKDFKTRSLYMSLAGRSPIRDKKTDMEITNRRFVKLLEKYDPRGLRWQWKRYQNEDHGTVPIPTEYDGLRFIFEGYQTQVREIIKNPAALTDKFEIISHQLGHKFIPPASYLEWMGDFCLKNGQKESALIFFKLYHEWYPESDHAKQKLHDIQQL